VKAWLGIGITLAAIVAAAAAPWLAPVDPLASDFAQSLRPPGAPGHPPGTDQLGRDLLARVLYGARLALFLGACTVVVTAVGGGRAGRGPRAFALPSRAPQRRAVDHRRGQPAVPSVHRGGSRHLVPGLRCSAAHARVGLDAGRGPRLPLRRVVAGRLSGRGAGTDGAWREPARRLAPRHPRSEASRLTEALCAPSSAPSPSFSSSSPSPLPRSPRTGSRARRS